MCRWFVLVGLLIISAATAFGEQVIVAIDVSRSVRGSEWTTLKERVVADVTGLPEGSSLRVISFGGSVRAPDVFQGEVELGTAKTVETPLKNLRADSNWMFFDPVLDGCHPRQRSQMSQR